MTRKKQQPSTSDQRSKSTRPSADQRDSTVQVPVADLAAIIEEQMRISLRTAQALQAVAGRPIDLSGGGSGPVRQHGEDHDLGATRALSPEHQQLETENAELLKTITAHQQRVTQLQYSIRHRLYRLLSEITTSVHSDVEEAANQAEQIARVIEQAEALIGDGDNVLDPPHSKIEEPPVDNDQPEPTLSKVDEQIASEVTAEQVMGEDEAPTDEATDPPSPSAVASPADADTDAADEPSPQCRRTSHRLRVESVQSSLGEIIDMSLGGARLNSTRPVEGVMAIDIKSGEHEVTLQAKIAWCERMSWRHYEVGVQFLNVSQEDAATLTRICMESRMQRTMGDD